LEYPKAALEALISPHSQKFPTHIQRLYIQAVPKVLASWATEVTSSWTSERKLEMEFMVEQILKWLEPFKYSTDLEVQERAVGFAQIFTRLLDEVREVPVLARQSYQDEAAASWDSSQTQSNFPTLAGLAALFGETEINPVSVKAQRRVPVPEGLDLHGPLYVAQQRVSWPPDTLDEEPPPKLQIAENVLTERQRREHLERATDDPFYILSDNRRPISRSETPVTEDDFDSIPIVQFDGGTNLLTPAVTKVKKKKKKAREIVLEEVPVDIAADEMPENATLSDTEMNGKKETRRGGNNLLSNRLAKGLEDIDFEEEERLEKGAMGSGGANHLKISMDISQPAVEEPLVVERVKKKKKKKKEGINEKKSVNKGKDKALEG
jgi:AP-3 complex subunit delta